MQHPKNRRSPVAMIINDKNQVPHVKTRMEARAIDGYPLEMIEAKQVLELVPRLAGERTLGGVYGSIPLIY